MMVINALLLACKQIVFIRNVPETVIQRKSVGKTSSLMNEVAIK